MNLDFFVVMSNLVGLFALIAAGYLAVKCGVLSPSDSAQFSKLLLKITLPCTIFISLAQKEYNPAFIDDSIIIIIAGFVGYLAMLYISRYLGIFMRVPKDCRGVWAFLCAFNNSGFMGFPIALALLGAEGLALSVMMNISFNATTYTFGALEIARDNPNHNAEKIDMKSVIFSNINIATLLSLIFYFGRIHIPDMIAAPISYLSGITTPLSMIIIGMALSRSHGLEVFKDIHAWTCTLMRLVIYPVIFCVILRVWPLSSNPMVSAAYIVIMSMPGASVTAVLCEMYHGNIDFAAKVMFLQNLLCIVSIPLVCMLIA